MIRRITLSVGAFMLGLLLFGDVASRSEQFPPLPSIQQMIERRGGQLASSAKGGQTPKPGRPYRIAQAITSLLVAISDRGATFWAQSFVVLGIAAPDALPLPAKDDTVRFIDCNDLNGADIVLLKGIPDLKYLDLRLSRVAPDVLFAVTQLPGVTDLDLSNTRITDAELPILAAMPRLAHLSLNCTTVTGEGLACFTHAFLNRPIYLELARTNVQLCDLKVLTQLSLTGLNLSDTAADNDWLAGLPANLEELKLARTNVKDAGLKAIPLSLRKTLKLLDLSGNKVTDAGVSEIAELSQLEGLFLADTMSVKCARKPDKVKRITDQSLPYLEKLTQLAKLDLSGALVTDAKMHDYLIKATNLEWLNLSRTPITGKFADKVMTLETLNLSETPVDHIGLTTVAEITSLADLWLLSTDLDNKTLVDGLGNIQGGADLVIHVGGEGNKITKIGVLGLVAKRNVPSWKNVFDIKPPPPRVLRIETNQTQRMFRE